MPRHNNHTNINNQQSGHCKIRKRVSSSSSSCSAVKKKKNYRFKRVSTPTWKRIMAAASDSPLQRLHNFEDVYNNNKGKEALSARKLAATFWEINDLHSPAGLKKQVRNKSVDRDPHTPHNSSHQQIDGSKVGGHRRRCSATSHKFQVTDYISGGLGKASSIEVASHMTALEENNISVKTRLKDVNNSLIASKELVKVLFRIEEQHSSRMTLVSALRVELDRARLQVDKLIQEQRNQIDALLKQFAEEKAAWKRKERESVSSLTRELEMEKKLRRQAERLNKKLGLELADTRVHFSKAIKELDSEKRAREILEQTCDELARGIGEERVEVEQLKRESAKEREEVEKERQMLQLADVLREERVQMKLAEARYEYEEKNNALERLKSEIWKHGDGTTTSNFLRKMQMENEADDGMLVEGDSGDSELHSIELNMDNNRSFSCEGNNQRDEVFKGRRSLSEKIQWESICLQKKTSEWDFTANNKLANIHEFETGRSAQVCDDNARDDYLFKKNNPIKFQTCQGSASPAISTGNSSPLREACSAILQDLAIRRDQFQFQGHKHCMGNKK